MNPLFQTDFSISDSLKSVRKSVLIYETIISVANKKQELHARLWAYNRVIGLTGLIRAYEHSCHGSAEIAEFLGVTEEFLEEAIKCYESKYGEFTTVDNYVIRFIPTLGIAKLF